MSFSVPSTFLKDALAKPWALPLNDRGQLV